MQQTPGLWVGTAGDWPRTSESLVWQPPGLPQPSLPDDPEERTMDPGLILGPVDGARVPRFAGAPTFARLPRVDKVADFDVAVLGCAFRRRCSFRPGARSVPAVRPAATPAAPYRLASTWRRSGCLGGGRRDVPCNPFDIDEALAQVADHAGERSATVDRWSPSVVSGLGARAPCSGSIRMRGPVALVHFDAHLDTWDTYFGDGLTHGTVFRRAFEEGLLHRTSQPTSGSGARSTTRRPR